MKILVLFAALLCVAAARAQNRIVSVDAFQLGYSGGLMFKNDSGKGDTKDRDLNLFKINANFAQTISEYPNLMFKGVGRIERNHLEQGADTTNSVYALSAGVIVNHDAADIKNSMFAGVLVGGEWETIEQAGQGDEKGLNIVFNAEAGKRWDMGNYAMANISYAPTFEFVFRRYGGGIRDEYYTSGTELKINFLKFDVLF